MRFVLGIIIVGAVLIWQGYQEIALANTARAEPDVISCADLAKQGPAGNAHLVLVDCTLGENFVYESQENSSTYDKVWIPAFSDPQAKWGGVTQK